MLGAVTVVMLALGVLLVCAGVFLTLRRAPVGGNQANEGMSGLVKALAELATALQGYPAGLVLIFLGVLLLLASAVTGAVGTIAG